MGLFVPSKGTPEPAFKYAEEIVVTRCMPFVDVFTTRLRSFLKNLVRNDWSRPGLTTTPVL